MLIYFLAFFITLLFCLISRKVKNRKIRYIFMVLSAMPFFLIAAFRNNVGIDTWLNYRPIFENVANYGERFDVLPFLLQKYEIGFSLIVMALAKISNNSLILFTVCSAIIMTFVFIAIYKQSKIPLLSICIFFLSGAFLLSMNGMRNFVALAIVLFSFSFLYDRKPIKYLVCILIATTIHKSMIIFIILYPLYNLRLSQVKILIILGISLLMSFFIDKIAYFFIRWTSYVDYFTESKGFINPLYSMLIINFIFLILFMLNYPLNKEDRKYNLYLKLQLLSCIVCIFSFKIPLSFRVEQIIDFFQIITVPYNIFLLFNNKNIKKHWAIILLILTLSIYSIYFTKVFVLADDNQVRNYNTVFNKELR